MDLRLEARDQSLLPATNAQSLYPSRGCTVEANYKTKKTELMKKNEGDSAVLKSLCSGSFFCLN